MNASFILQVPEDRVEINTYTPSSPHATEVCSSCQDIAKAVIARKFESPERMTLELGSWQGFLDRTQCVCCQKIVRYFKQSYPYTIMFEPSCPLRIFNMKHCFWLTADSPLDPHAVGQDGFRNHPLLKLTPVESYGMSIPRSIPVDPTSIDISRLIRWLAYCSQHHQGSCHEMPHWQNIPPASSLIIVDVHDHCLVETFDRMSQSYATLSYVWGQTSGSLELKRDNLSQLCIRNSLKLPAHWSRMPKTIRDAILLTSLMGLRYLWIDRLCIIQDEPTHLTKHLQQMAQIYANAQFTIVAEDGFDADYGLHGVDSGLSPRSYIEEVFEFAANVKMIQKPKQESAWNPPFWHTRAWTFQERAVSRRTLVFTKDTVYWHCRSATWYENLPAEPDGVPPPSPYTRLLFGWPSYWLNVTPWPDIDHYFNLVGGYNNRNLSFESDTVRAFTAITTAMSRSFPDGFYFGIPIFLFDLGMLWSGSKPLKRRTSWPSWSWVGWQGDVKLHFGYKESWKPILDWCDATVDIEPLFDWDITDGHGVRRKSNDTSSALQKMKLEDPNVSLPERWTRTWNEKHDVEAVQHESLPDHSFKFPFPMFPAMVDDVAEPSSSYLKFEAESCTLILGSSSRSRFKSEPLLKVDLKDNRGRWAGVIESQFVHQDEYTFGTPCEIIAISQGRAKRNEEVYRDKEDPLQPFDEMNTVREINQLEEYEFYNVLWIEWTGSVAYRKTLGRVWKEAWRLQDVKLVDVVLG